MHPVGDRTARDERLERLEERLAEQQETIAALEARVQCHEVAKDTNGRVTRRRLLAGAGAAAAGAVAGALGHATPAGATAVTTGTADGDALQISGANTATSGTVNPTALSGSQAGAVMTAILKVTQNGEHIAIWGEQAGTSGAAAVLGRTTFSGGGVGVSGIKGGAGAGGIGTQGQALTVDGIGVRAISSQGAALVLFDSSQVIPPTTGSWTAGSFVVTAGHVWYCYGDGTGSVSKWMRLSSPFVPLPAPFRIYDSRMGQANPSGSLQGVLAFGGGARPINCSPTVPALPVGTTAILFNVTLANTVGGVGSVVVWANGVSEPATASITWTGNGVVVGNAVTSACDTSQDVQIKCTTGTSTHVILDVLGYYL